MSKDVQLTSIIFGLFVIYFTIPSMIWGVDGFMLAMVAALVWGSIYACIKTLR
jgi:hypothetical protein